MPAWFIMQPWPHSAIYEISAIVGYSSQSNFARNFLKQFNMTPTEYMQSLHQKKEKGIKAFRKLIKPSAFIP